MVVSWQYVIANALLIENGLLVPWIHLNIFFHRFILVLRKGVQFTNTAVSQVWRFVANCLCDETFAACRLFAKSLKVDLFTVVVVVTWGGLRPLNTFQGSAKLFLYSENSFSCVFFSLSPVLI